MLSPTTQQVRYRIVLVAVAVVGCTLQFVSRTAAPTYAGLADTATASPTSIASPAPTSTPAGRIAPIQFLEAQTNPFEGWEGLEEAAAKSGIDLDVSGIYALDQNTAFLFGGMVVYGNTLFSIRHYRE
jgi:hypothetical protein